MTLNYVLDLKTLGFGQLKKVFSLSKDVKTNFEILENSLNHNTKSMKNLTDSKFSRFFSGMNNKLLVFGKRQQALKKAGNNFGIMKSNLQDTFTILRGISGGGIKGFKKLIALGSSWGAGLLVGALAGKLVMSVWENNIGGVQSKWNVFTGRLKTTMSRFDLATRKTLRSMNGLFSKVFDSAFNLLSGVFEGMVTTLIFMGKVIKPVVSLVNSLFGSASTGGKDSVSIIKVLGQTLGILAPIIIGIAIATKLWAAMQWLFNVAMNANPIGLFIVGIVALIAAVTYLYKRFKIVRDVVSVLFEGLKSQFTFIWGIIKKVIDGIGTVISLGSKVANFFGGGSDKAVNQVAPGIQGTSSNSVDNRQANVTINTSNLTPGNAQTIGNGFIDPIMQSNKTN